MARRGSSTMTLKKKREEAKEKVKNLGGTKKYVTNRTGGSAATTVKSTKKMTAQERAKASAKTRLAAKKAGTYKKPKTAQELAKARLKIKKKK